MNYTDFRLLVICFMLSNGQFTSFGAILSDTLAPFGYSPSEMAVQGAIFIVLGIILSILVSRRLDGTASYRQTQLYILVLIFVFLSLLVVASFLTTD